MDKNHTLIAGGTSGIGRALVRHLAKSQGTISVIGRNVKDLDKEQQNASYWNLDILDKESLKKALSEVIEKNGKLNNLVFFQRYRGGGDDWIGEIEVSLTSTKNIIDLLADKFGKNGSIVILSSTTSKLVSYEMPLSYHIAKACINQMIRYYAIKLGPKGIRANSIVPGAVLKEETKEFYDKNPELHNLYKKITPLGRMCTPKDICDVIEFLLSPESSFITGQNIVIDGGVSLVGHEALARKLMSLETDKLTKKLSDKKS